MKRGRRWDRHIPGTVVRNAKRTTLQQCCRHEDCCCVMRVLMVHHSQYHLPC